MAAIPDVQEGERFVAIEEEPGYFISNFKRIYSSKTKQFLKLEVQPSLRFTNSKHKHIYVNPLFNKYFNQPDELDLIAIVRYGNHRLQNYYFDRQNDKFYHLDDDIYSEIEPHQHSANNKSKVIYVSDIQGKHLKIVIKKFKKYL